MTQPAIHNALIVVSTPPGQRSGSKISFQPSPTV